MCFGFSCLCQVFGLLCGHLSAAVVGLANAVKLAAVVKRPVVSVRVVAREEAHGLVAAAAVAAARRRARRIHCHSGLRRRLR